ncbi:MAG TPA: hypothetical protein VGM23_14455 [Armatimonadota bacterium]|jgi:hypothetical protein
MILLIALTSASAARLHQDATAPAKSPRKIVPDSAPLGKTNRLAPLTVRKAFHAYRAPHARAALPLNAGAGFTVRPRRSASVQPRLLIGEAAAFRGSVRDAYLRDVQTPPALPPNHLALFRTENLLQAMTHWFRPHRVPASAATRLARWSFSQPAPLQSSYPR